MWHLVKQSSKPCNRWSPVPENHTGSGFPTRCLKKGGKRENTNNQRQQQHERCWLPVGMKNLAQGVEPDNFLLSVISWLIWIFTNGNVRVSVADNGSVGQPVRVPEHHPVDQREHV